MGRLGILLKSKTLWGSVLTAGAWLLHQQGGPSAVDVIQAVGGVITAAGVRDAIGQVQTGNYSPPDQPPR
jgi:hypothetical protein